ncbi:MAG: LCP family protein [Clostridia bacterium]|nr:LCP family protein [Clostridia bacterium]MBO4886088.1 LCP family protein [Clostridia bacterium]MBR4442379.1 LCP family protein [Clostridia bacterium]
MKHMIIRFLALLLALALAAGAALAETGNTQGVEEALESEENDLSIYSEEKVHIDPNELALTEGLDSAWRNILLCGSDTRVAGSYGRTDAMVVISVNASKKQVKLTSIMRDIWTPMKGRSPQKISAANVFGGPTLAMRTVNEQFGMNISDYVFVDMAGMEELIDILGGIEMDITEDEMWGLNNSWNRDASALIEPVTAFGENVHLNGEQALAYARLRNIDNDYKRTVRQREVLVAIARKASHCNSSELLSFIREGIGYVETNLSMTDIIQLAVLAVLVDLDNVEQFRLPAEGAYTTGYEGQLWVMWPDFEKNRALLHEFIYGGN